MANVNAPLGFRPVTNGKAGTAPLLTEYVRSSTAVIYEGALLYLEQEGPRTWSGTATGQLQIVGVAAHYCSATDLKVLVYDDPEQEFEIQGDTAVTTPIGAIGWFGPLVAVTGNATTLQSKSELDTSGLSSVYTATHFNLVQVRRLPISEDNDQDAADAKWIVKIIPAAHILATSVSRDT